MPVAGSVIPIVYTCDNGSREKAVLASKLNGVLATLALSTLGHNGVEFHSQDRVISRFVERYSLQHSIVCRIRPVGPWVVLPVSNALTHLKRQEMKSG